MNMIILDTFTDFAKGLTFSLPSTGANAAMSLASNPNVLIAGIVLVVVSVVILFFLKKFIEHAILGGIAWALAIFAFHIPLPLIPSLVIAVIFGPAGVGVMLLLKFFGFF